MTRFPIRCIRTSRDKNEVFSGVLARGGAQMNVSYEGRSDRIRGELVSGNYFEVLGVRPWVGRLFNAGR